VSNALDLVSSPRVQRGEIHYPPWPLQEARADIELNTTTRAIGVDVREPPLLHFAARQEVVFWRLEPAGP